MSTSASPEGAPQVACTGVLVVVRSAGETGALPVQAHAESATVLDSSPEESRLCLPVREGLQEVIITGAEEGKYMLEVRCPGCHDPEFVLRRDNAVVNPGLPVHYLIELWPEPGPPFTLQSLTRKPPTGQAAPSEIVGAHTRPEHSFGDHLSGITIFLRPQVAEMLVTDALGRRTGVNPATGDTYAEIPGAEYGDNPSDEPSNSSREFGVNRPSAGEYIVRVTGIGTGTYRLAIRTYSRDGAMGSKLIEDVPTVAGMTHQYVLTFDPATPGGLIDVQRGPTSRPEQR
jgi:hypothetical protein